MPETIRNHRGMILFITLATLLVVVILASIILGIMNSQSRITHDQVSRIRAHGAAQAGMIFALENLRTGNWAYGSDCLPPNGCIYEDTSFPANIRDPLTTAIPRAQRVRIVFCPAGQQCQWTPASSVCTPPAGTGINFCINVTANYTPQ